MFSNLSIVPDSPSIIVFLMFHILQFVGCIPCTPVSTSSAYQFKFGDANNPSPGGGDGDLVVTGATVAIHIRPRTTTVVKGSQRAQHIGGEEHNHYSRRKSPPQRIVVRIYSLPENVAGTTSEKNHSSSRLQRESGKSSPYKGTSYIITEMSMIARKPQWEKILLPTTVVQNAMNSPQRVLRLLIECDHCYEIETHDPASNKFTENSMTRSNYSDTRPERYRLITGSSGKDILKSNRKKQPAQPGALKDRDEVELAVGVAGHKDTTLSETDTPYLIVRTKRRKARGGKHKTNSAVIGGDQ